MEQDKDGDAPACNALKAIKGVNRGSFFYASSLFMRIPTLHFLNYK